MLMTEVSMHSLRSIVYNRFVFTTADSGLRTYLTAAVPLSLLNMGLVFFLRGHLYLWQMAVYIGFQNATVGYLWSRVCYRYDISSRLRARRKT